MIKDAIADIAQIATSQALRYSAFYRFVKNFRGRRLEY
jgi:hypothetical protein